MDKAEFNRLFGSYAKKVREKNGLSQADVAAEMGINPQNVSQMERGIVSPSMYWVDRLCAAMKVDPGDFLTGFYQK